MRKYSTLLLFVLLIISCQNKDNSEEIKPQKRDITESVYASVNVIPERTYHPQPIRSGIIDKVYVNEGDHVNEGQLLFQITPTTDITGQLTNAEINLEEAKSNYFGRNNLLNNIKLEIQATKEALDLDSINLHRQEKLMLQNIGKKIDYDQMKLKYQSTKSKLEILEQQFIQTKTTLETNYKKALNRIDTDKKQLADFKVFSKMEGEIYAIYKEEGELISVQEEFAEIGVHDNFKIEMDIDEVDITKVEVGDSVLIVLDAYTDEVFIAKVSKIFPKKNDVTQTFRVESTFEQVPPKLYYGFSGEANIIISQRNNALVIPADYLMSNSSVLTTNGEKNVKIGMKNLAFVEILSGIDSTTVLIKP